VIITCCASRSPPRPPCQKLQHLHNPSLQQFNCFTVSDRRYAPPPPCSVMSSSFWADACNFARNKPLQTQLDTAYASCGVTVRRAAVHVVCAACRSDGDAVAAQVAAYCVSALASGTMLLRWLRMDGQGRQWAWWLYGWFSGLMLCGSCCGAVAWGALMRSLVSDFRFKNPSYASTLSAAQYNSLHAQSHHWAAVFMIPYAIAFLCLSAAKLMALDQMMNFAVSKSRDMPRRWVVWGRVVMAGVVVGNVVGLGGNVAAAVYWEQSAVSYRAASAAYAANSTAAGDNFVNIGVKQDQLADSTQAVQLFCEVAVLLVIIVAFAVTGAACVRRFTSAQLDDTAEGRQLWRQIVGTAGFVFVTFLLRAVYSTMRAVADGLQDYGAICPSGNSCDASCYNLYTLMHTWLTCTPEFQLSVELISSPMTLLVALWGMTSKHTLRLMQSRRREMNVMRVGMLQETGAA